MENYEKTDRMIELAFMMQCSYEGVSLEDIQRHFEVSRRTAERMIAALSRIFPNELIEVDIGERTKHWRISSRRLNSLVSISTEEMAMFETVISALYKSGMPEQAELLKQIKGKLRSLIRDQDMMNRIDTDADVLMRAEGLAARPGPKIVVDKEIISKIREAVLSCHQIRIAYFNRGSGKISRNTLMPYGILYGTGDHYLLARHSDGHGGGKVHHFSLSFIQEVEILPDTYQIPEDFDLKKFSERSFGIFQEEPFEVEWLFDKEAAPNAKRYIFHPTQEMIENEDGSLTVKFKAGGAREMDWHLYTWGEHVKVIKPEDWEERKKKGL